ncbi:MAG: hypothetical protein KAR39_12705 [Thermoplasmata archaeon]|nr:hypothetical protein [Thermoplasmata archaeon]
MQLYLSEEDKDRLRAMATEMGINVPYHYGHGQPQAMYVLSTDGNLQTIIPDTWIVDMFEEIIKRIKSLEEKSGLPF